MEIDLTGSAWITEPRCRTCRSRCRPEVEQALAEGHGATHVATRLFPEAGLTPVSIRRHRDHHMPAVEKKALARIDSEPLVAQAEHVEAMVATVESQVRLHRQVAARAVQRLEAGEVEPSVAEGLIAERLLADIAARAGERDEARRWHDAYVGLVEVVGQVVVEEQQRKELANLAARHPALTSVMGA